MIKDVKRKRGFSFGSFFFGTFLGFLLCIGAIVGLGFFAYNKISVKWVNDKFKTEIDLGTEQLNSKTIKEFTTTVTNMLSDIDNYTIDKLNKDFGLAVDDEIMGLDIKDLKYVPFKDLSTELENKFTNISADEIDGVMDLSNMDDILNKYNTYYYDGSYLYKDTGCSDKVEFEYTIDSGVVTIKNKTYSIQDNKITVQLRYLPLPNAISDFTSNMGDQITLGELESDYGVTLPSYFDDVDKSVTINELSEEIDKLHLASFLGYKYDDGQDKYYDDKNDNNILDSGEELSGVINAIADTTVSGLSEKIDSLTIQDLFPDSLNEGVLSLLPANTNVNKIDEALETAFTDITLGELIEAKIIDAPTNYEDVKEKYVKGTNILVKDLQIDDIVSQFVENIEVSDDPATV